MQEHLIAQWEKIDVMWLYIKVFFNVIKYTLIVSYLVEVISTTNQSDYEKSLF